MGKGGSAPSQPSTTTQIADIPEWERPYVENLLGQAQTVAAQPYQQFPGPKIAGFTPDQLQAFSNIQGAGATNQANQAAAFGAAGQGANTANGIYDAGAGYTNAATGYNPLAAVAPYLGAASQYNAAAASQPWLNQAANYQGAAAATATPQGIQNYMSPYTNSVVQGIQNQANQNWNQNIMPGINDKFVGSGQYASGRNSQVLGREAGNFQTGLSANVANALESGYNMAGNQAAQQAQLLSGLGGQALTGANTAGGMQTAQVSNLLNQAGAAGTATQQQATNLQSAGAQLGNLANTQASAQLASGKVLGDLSGDAAKTNLAQDSALQAIGQQQQQGDQSNLNVAQQDFQNQINWPKQQTQYLSEIIHGLPTGTQSTSVSEQTPAYSVSPLSGVGGSITGLLGSLSGGKKEGGLVEGYASGGLARKSDSVSSYLDDSDALDNVNADVGAKLSPLDYALFDNNGRVDNSDSEAPKDPAAEEPASRLSSNPLQNLAAQSAPQARQNPLDLGNSPTIPLPTATSSGQSQQDQLLAMARGMLTPTAGGSGPAAFGQALTNMQEVQMQERQNAAGINKIAYERQQDAAKLALQKESIDDLRQYRKDALAIKGNANNNSYINEGNSSLKGKDLLSTLPPDVAKLVPQIASGQYNPNGRSKDKNELIAAAIAYDPTLSLPGAGIAERQKSVTSFSAGGKDSENIKSLNTAISHLVSMKKGYDKLDNGGLPLWNTTVNTIEEQGGNKRVQGSMKDIQAGANGLSGELSKVFRSQGQSLKEIDDWKTLLGTNLSETQSTAVRDKALDLMMGRLQAIADNYNTAYGTNRPAESFLSPTARKQLEKMQSNSSENDGAPDGDTASSGNNSLEGKTATNKATGEKMINKGGQWVPLQ